MKGFSRFVLYLLFILLPVCASADGALSGKIIYFEPKATTLNDKSIAILDGLFSKNQLNTKQFILISGYADNSVSNPLSASKDRAYAVKNYLINKGIPESNIITCVGLGEDVGLSKSLDAKSKQKEGNKVNLLGINIAKINGTVEVSEISNINTAKAIPEDADEEAKEDDGNITIDESTKYGKLVNGDEFFGTLNSKDKSSQKIQKLILNYINIWTTAESEKKSAIGRTSNNAGKIYGIEKLRQLILDLAISGRLVAEKDTNNSNVNILKDIEIEKKNLIEKGLLTKKKILPPITEDEKIFILPKNWEWIRLGNTGKVFSGNSINENEKQAKYTNINEGRPFIATKDVGYGQEKLNYKNGISIPYNELKFKVAHKNAVLICSEGGSAGRKIGITELDICFGNKLLANETFSAINPRFIFYIYQSQSFYKLFSKRMNGIIGGISISEFLNIPMPIPPTKHQNEIVIKIDELMSLCDELELRIKEASAKQKNIADVLVSEALN